MTPPRHKPSRRPNTSPHQDWQRNVPAWQKDDRNWRLDKMWEMKRAKPATETEAIMMAAPNEELSVQPQDHPLKDVIAELLGEFNETDKALIVMKVVEGLSIRDIAEVMQLSKSDVHRRLKPLMERLKELFMSNPEIVEFMDD